MPSIHAETVFEQLTLPALAPVFLAGALVILWSGGRLERVTDEIALSTGMGRALAGIVLLALATSLPEVATTATAVLRGNVELAVTNLLGGVAFQVVVLVIADTAARKAPLTGQSPSFGVLIQGVGVLAMLGVATCGLALGSDAQWVTSVAGVSVGLHPVLLLLPLLYVAIVRLTSMARGNPRWVPVDRENEEVDLGTDGAVGGAKAGRRLWMTFSRLAGLVAVGGWVTASTADVIAAQTGASSAIVGATLLAAATSLPEISTTVTAARGDHHELAVSNVMGSNGFDVALLALVAVLAGDAFGVTSAALFMAGLGIVLTAVVMVGLLERSDRRVGPVGLDSVAVCVLYLAAVMVLFWLA